VNFYFFLPTFEIATINGHVMSESGVDLQEGMRRGARWKDERLAQSSLTSPQFGMCCKSGKVQLLDFHDPPLGWEEALFRARISS
jgi:hypothetical protein